MPKPNTKPKINPVLDFDSGGKTISIWSSVKPKFGASKYACFAASDGT